ncbi:MAG: 1-acyl-sn-glycerol-3-phosphate acyltransferase, partial [Candidatus Heimdallarchaeota archaeon]
NANPPKRWSFSKRAIYQFLTPILPRAIRSLFHFEVFGKEFADQFPEGKGVIFCTNHQSHLDGPIIASTLINPFGCRKFLGFIGSGKAMKENFLFRSLTLIGGIPIFRENPKPTLNYVSRSLQEGFAILITPQGRRIHRTPFHDYFSLTEEGRTGVGRIVLTTNGEIPVVPLYIRGTAEVLRPGTLKPKFGSYISVSFGEPLYFHQYSRQDGWSESISDFFPKSREITDKIMKSIRDLFLDTEKHYLNFLEWKFNTELIKITISSKKEKEFNRFLHKVACVPPNQIKKFLELKR